MHLGLVLLGVLFSGIIGSAFFLSLDIITFPTKGLHRTQLAFLCILHVEEREYISVYQCLPISYVHVTWCSIV